MQTAKLFCEPGHYCVAMVVAFFCKSSRLEVFKYLKCEGWNFPCDVFSIWKFNVIINVTLGTKGGDTGGVWSRSGGGGWNVKSSRGSLLISSELFLNTSCVSLPSPSPPFYLFLSFSSIHIQLTLSVFAL